MQGWLILNVKVSSLISNFILGCAGPCGYEVHEDHIECARLKKEYDEAPSSVKAAYSKDLLEVLDELVKEMDRKIARAKERVEQENKPRTIRSADQVKLDALKQQEKGSTLNRFSV